MAVKKKPCWLFPTNTNNLRMILAQGLLTSPDGFSKYYQDALRDYDGYLPLFNHTVPTSTLEIALSEAEHTDHLVPCLLEFNLSVLSGEVKALINNELKEVDFDLSESYDNIERLLIQLPLPLSCITKVIFKTKDDIDVFVHDSNIRSNVVLSNIKLSSTATQSKLFDPPKIDTMPISDNIASHKTEISLKKLNYNTVYAYGGLLSLLFYFSKNGELSHHLFSKFSQNMIPESDSPKEHSIPKIIHDYFHSNINESKPENKILKGIITSCIDTDNFKNSLINFLQDSDWGDEKMGKRSCELANKLNDYASNSSRPVSEWFENAKSSIEKVLLMLFAREDSDSLIHFKNQKINFTEYEYILFAMFFGMRDGFIKTPDYIRKYNNLQEYISYKMAIYAHKQLKSNLTFKELDPPKTVWQYINNKPSKVNIKHLKLESCVQTIMPKTDFRHEKGVNIYNGFHEPKYKIINNDYLRVIKNMIIMDTDYNRLK